MKFILGALLILSGAALAAEPLSNQKLLAGDVLDAQQTKGKLDSRIPPPDPPKYEGVRDGNDWLNPYLVIRPEGVEIISRTSSVVRRIVSRNDLKRVLISLPVAAWPYGRIIAAQEIGIRGGVPGSDVWRRDEELIEKNKLETKRVLASLGVKINWWPSS